MLNTKSLFENKGIYFGEETINGIPCQIGYIKKFKWGWMATQLNTFIIIGRIEQKAEKKIIEDFSAASLQYAIKNNKGWPRGFQAAVGSIAILQAPDATEDALNFCTTLSKKHWSAFEIPVLYNTVRKETVRFQKNPMWGAIYMSYFKNTIDNITGKMS